MTTKEIKNIKSGKRELRQFGITISIVLGLLGCLFLWREKDWYFYLLVVSTVFLFLGLIRPFLLKPIHEIWMTLAILIGWFMTRLIIIILFYLVVTPIGLLARFFGKDFLDTKFNRNVDSYWVSKKTINFNKRNYENQF